MTYLDAIILGIVQGLAEFLPISSSGHIEIGKVLLLSEENVNNVEFTLFVHLATVISTIVVFHKEFKSLFFGIFSKEINFEKLFALNILVSIVPVGIAYILFKDQIENLFNGNLLLVGICLMVTALLLFASKFAYKNNKHVNMPRAFIIGIAQAIALLPGISRSGATISAALILGVDKEEATRFSFFMVLPPIVGASLLQIMELDERSLAFGQTSIDTLLFGFFAALITGILACKIMISLVKSGKIHYFSLYCLILGLGLILYSVI